MILDRNCKEIELEFQKFFTTNFPIVKNFALMLLKSEDDAEDVAQDVFCKLWLQPEIWMGNSRKPDDYLFIMTKNIILNIFKHQQIEQNYQEELIDNNILDELTDMEQTANNIYYKEMQMIIRLTLERMPKRRRMIFELSRFKGLSHKEIAERMNVTVRTIEHQIYLATAEMKKILFLSIFFAHLFK